MLTQQVTRESFVLAYDDAFRLIAVIAALALGLMTVIAIRATRREAQSSSTAAKQPQEVPNAS